MLLRTGVPIPKGVISGVSAHGDAGADKDKDECQECNSEDTAAEREKAMAALDAFMAEQDPLDGGTYTANTPSADLAKKKRVLIRYSHRNQLLALLGIWVPVP